MDTGVISSAMGREQMLVLEGVDLVPMRNCTLFLLLNVNTFFVIHVGKSWRQAVRVLELSEQIALFIISITVKMDTVSAGRC